MGSAINLTPAPNINGIPLPLILAGVWVVVALILWSEEVPDYAEKQKQIGIWLWTAFCAAWWIWALTGGLR